MTNNNNSNLNYILGGEPIEEFNNAEPTNGDVLRFYSKFWRKNETDTSKEARVASALKNLYRQRNIQTLNELTIPRKIHSQILSLKKFLKFKSKEKTPANIEMENAFKMGLAKVFEIKTSPRDAVIAMDIDNENEDLQSNPGKQPNLKKYYSVKTITYCSENFPKKNLTVDSSCDDSNFSLNISANGDNIYQTNSNGILKKLKMILSV